MSFLQAFIRHNFWLKLFSFLLATLIWFTINFGIKNNFQSSQNPITNPMTREFVHLPVRILARPGDSRIFKVEPDEVIVSLTGEEAVLRDLTPKNFTAFVDLANVRSSHETNQQVRLDIPDGVTVIKMSPRAVNVEQVSP